MSLFPVLVDIFHKELVTKEEAEKAAYDKRRWVEVAATKDGVTATRIADILDEYGIKYLIPHIRGMCVLMSVCINTVQDSLKRHKYLEC